MERKLLSYLEQMREDSQLTLSSKSLNSQIVHREEGYTTAEGILVGRSIGEAFRVLNKYDYKDWVLQ